MTKKTTLFSRSSIFVLLLTWTLTAAQAQTTMVDLDFLDLSPGQQPQDVFAPHFVVSDGFLQIVDYTRVDFHPHPGRIILQEHEGDFSDLDFDFAPGLRSLTFVRMGTSLGASTPGWILTLFDGDGNVLGSIGDGDVLRINAPIESFSFSAPDEREIARARLENFYNLATMRTAPFIRWTFEFTTGPSSPELSIATEIPAAELETVDVEVELATNGASIAGTAFSLDYDEACLVFDDTDADADGIPDDLAIDLPDDFTLAAFHDLGDFDGELDVSIVDLSPPFATIPDGILLTVTFQATCSPAIDTTLLAPVGFSSDPAASFSDDLAMDVEGTTSDGGVEIWPGPRGDCNRNGEVAVADLIAGAFEIFDDDGTFWADVPGSTYAGSPVGCDSNADTEVDAGDLSCTILRIFGGVCGGQSFAERGTTPRLRLRDVRRGEDGRLWLPIVFSPGVHSISSLAFTLDFPELDSIFDPFDGNGDGAPDAVRFPQGRPDLAEVRYDAADRDGELDIVLANLGTPLADGVLLEIGLGQPRNGFRGIDREPIRFGAEPPASFGNLSGQSVPGRVFETRGLDLGDRE